MLKCRVWGWYSKNNIGDESYKLSFPMLFPDVHFDFEGSQDEYDFCLLGGGDILNEHYVRKALECPCKARYIVSVSAGSKAPIDLLNEFDGIYVRDHASEVYLRSRGIQCAFMPDVAMRLQPDVVEGQTLMNDRFAAEGLDSYERRIGLVFNAHLLYAREGVLARDFVTFLKAAQDIGKLADETSASFVFFPMSTGMPYDDRISNGFLASRCKFWKKNWLVQDRLSVQETLNLISACDLVISTRLHSSIFSLISHVPFVDLVHHDKNRSLLETMHLDGHGVSYWSFSFEELKNMLDRMFGIRESHVQKLRWKHQHCLDAITRETRCMFR